MPTLHELGLKDFDAVGWNGLLAPAGTPREIVSRLHAEVVRWRAALRRAVAQAVEAGHLKADTDPEQMVGEISSLAIGLLHDARFLRDSHAAERAAATWQRLLQSYRA